MAINGRHNKGRKLIHHFDRGIQYCCDEYQKVLQKNNLEVSMTESYDPYVNAVAERVNGIIKNDFELERYALDKEVLEGIVRESIFIYNNKRPHMS